MSSTPEKTEPEFMTAIDLSKRLNISIQAVKKWTAARRVPGQIKVGNRWRYSRLAIEKALLRGQFLEG
jgi:predicted site-specific integrase-resolvase